MVDTARFEPKTVYVTYIAATPDRVWQALTDGDFSQRYFFGFRVDVEPRQGGQFRLYFVGRAGRDPRRGAVWLAGRDVEPQEHDRDRQAVIDQVRRPAFRPGRGRATSRRGKALAEALIAVHSHVTGESEQLSVSQASTLADSVRCYQ
ncbi:MAG: SRPBCC domain-containing protein [Pseudolabrys sp.]|jgi:hypothetical protein